MIGVTGYLCIDLFPDLGKEPFAFVPGGLRETGRVAAAPGGVVGNTGRALCRLGVPARLGGVVGDDLFGDMLRELLREDGAGLRTFPGETTGYSIVLSPADSDRMFLVCRGVNDHLAADSYGPDFRRGLKIFHFGYPPLCGRMAANDGAELKRLFRDCRNDGILTSLDLSLPSPGTASYELDWRAFLRNVLPETDLFTPSVDELRFMLKDSAASPEGLAGQALAMGCRAVFLKLGKEGALLCTADTDGAEQAFARFGSRRWRNLAHMVRPRPVKVIGTTGAGDTAIAGLLAGIYSGLGGEAAANLAVRVAEAAITSKDSIWGLPKLAAFEVQS